MTPTQQAREWLRSCHILDTETTGLDWSAEVVEISIIDQDGNVVFDSLVKPTKPIPTEATAIHGITNEMVADAPTWGQIHEDVCRIINSKPLVIYNMNYDVRVMNQTAFFYGMSLGNEASVYCAMLTYGEFYGEKNRSGSYKWQKLSNAARQQGVVVDGAAHRALTDVQMTLGIIKAMAAKGAGK